MRIGIVLHGPEIVDEGEAKQIIGILGKQHDIIAKLGGTMGRTAVLDAGLEDVIDISMGLTPSETINALKESIDLAVLLNHGKTLETGRYFGSIVASKLDSSIPFIHIERPFHDGRIIYYNTNGKRCALYIRELLKKHDIKCELMVEAGTLLPLLVRSEGDRLVRRISGALPGENIRLEGIVIGHITHHEPEIICKDGRVIELRGVKVKQHGLTKLNSRKIDLYNAKVKTGNIRRTKHSPKVKPALSLTSGKKIAIIDHCAESTFELVKDVDIAITVGDDTTTIAADILSRLGIPVIGITDGDLDGILGGTIVPAGSVIIRVREGFDDIVGNEVFDKVMHSSRINIMQGDELLAAILTIAKKYLVDVKYY
ncbi:MAG: DUF2117 domain-containing protein [Euryarchaeota archaeon]|nr:DUF2117 domain-containing protein [Euryarchaeota archaeon]MCG2738403.1 DUF2117 domain-containing protein [Candidatus Methanoperedenaceae archaeon]